MTRLAQTCACGAQFSVDDTYHHGNYAYEELEKWRKEHICPLRVSPEREPSVFEPRLRFRDTDPIGEQFCGRTDLHPHRPHSWARRPDGSYGDYDDEGKVMIWCPGLQA